MRLSEKPAGAATPDGLPGLVSASQRDEQEHNPLHADRQVDLLAEFVAANRYDDRVIWPRLERLGVPSDVLAGIGIGPTRALFGVERIIGGRDGFYQPWPDGEATLIIPEGSAEFCGGWAAIDDLIAFKPSAPGTWWRRTGAGDILGSDHFDWCQWRGGLLKIHATPFDWLKAGGNGVCILEWSQGLAEELRRTPTLLFDDADHAATVWDWLLSSMPRVKVGAAA